MKEKRRKKIWPYLTEKELDDVVGRMPERHVAIKVQYPGDQNWYIECRRLPPTEIIQGWKHWKELPEK